MKAKKIYVEKFAGITSEEYKELGDRHRKALEIFFEHRFDRILDIGCGDGKFTVLIGKACKAKEVYGVDISERGIEMARKKGIKAFRVDVDEESLPFENNYFDAIYAGAIIEHLFDPDHFLNEIYRVLKPEGLLVLDTPNLASLYNRIALLLLNKTLISRHERISLYNRIALLLGYQPFDMHVSIRYPIGHIYDELYKQGSGVTDTIRGSDHIRLFTYKSLLLILKKHNLTILKVHGASDFIHSKSFVVSSLVRTIDCVISYIPSLSRNIVIIAHKSMLR